MGGRYPICIVARMSSHMYPWIYIRICARILNNPVFPSVFHVSFMQYYIIRIIIKPNIRHKRKRRQWTVLDRLSVYTLGAVIDRQTVKVIYD
jgi:hypothetical protein